jgi:hypothetical protein
MLILFPLLLIEMQLITIPVMTLDIGNWQIIVHEINIVAESLVPCTASFTMNQVFYVSVNHAQTSSLKTATMKFCGLNPVIEPVSYHLQRKKLSEAGQVQILFPKGIDLEFEYAISSSRQYPFK